MLHQQVRRQRSSAHEVWREISGRSAFFFACPANVLPAVCGRRHGGGVSEDKRGAGAGQHQADGLPGDGGGRGGGERGRDQVRLQHGLYRGDRTNDGAERGSQALLAVQDNRHDAGRRRGEDDLHSRGGGYNPRSDGRKGRILAVLLNHIQKMGFR